MSLLALLQRLLGLIVSIQSAFEIAVGYDALVVKGLVPLVICFLPGRIRSQFLNGRLLSADLKRRVPGEHTIERRLLLLDLRRGNGDGCLKTLNAVQRSNDLVLSHYVILLNSERLQSRFSARCWSIQMNHSLTRDNTAQCRNRWRGREANAAA